MSNPREGKMTETCCIECGEQLWPEVSRADWCCVCFEMAAKLHFRERAETAEARVAELEEERGGLLEALVNVRLGVQRAAGTLKHTANAELARSSTCGRLLGAEQTASRAIEKVLAKARAALEDGEVQDGQRTAV